LGKRKAQILRDRGNGCLSDQEKSTDSRGKKKGPRTKTTATEKAQRLRFFLGRRVSTFAGREKMKVHLQRTREGGLRKVQNENDGGLFHPAHEISGLFNVTDSCREENGIAGKKKPEKRGPWVDPKKGDDYLAWSASRHHTHVSCRRSRREKKERAKILTIAMGRGRGKFSNLRRDKRRLAAINR